MEKWLSFIVGAWLLLMPATTWSQVEGFEESFTGQGVYQSVGTNFDGLDNVAWKMDAAGELTEAGYAFNLDGRTPGGFPTEERIGRQVYGRGSFVQKIVLKDLQLGDRQIGDFEAGSEVQLSHSLVDGDPDSRLILSLSDPDEVGVWQLVLGAVQEEGFARQVAFVPKGAEYSSIGLLYDHERSSVSGYYDFNIMDEQPPLKLELPLTAKLSPESFTEFIAATLGYDTTGILHSWSLAPILPLTGDFSGNGAIDAADIDELSAQVRAATNDARFDLNANSLVDSADIAVWVHDLKKTYFGDANLDGQFDSQDLTLVFQAGQYEDTIEDNSTWATGDWDADAEFTSSDLVVAFQDGSYEKGPRPVAVPEPHRALFLAAVAASLRRRRSSRFRVS